MDRTPALTVVKLVHTAIWLVVESAIAYLLYSGVRRRSGRGAAIAGGVVAAETLVFVGNGFRCPLTDLAESMGSAHGSVTDLYLPRRLARSLPAIHVPLLTLAVVLHWRAIRRVSSAMRRYRRLQLPS
jgi:hypothetical protein